jgi:exonuclease SbcC
MTIERIEILNFQNHKKSILELSPGVNVISGPSDHGKSSIIRALSWGITNQPKGDGYRRDTAPEKANTSISIHFNNGTMVRRLRGPRGNYYEDHTGEIYRAIKTSVPDEILSILNMDERNIQTQFGRMFMLQQSPGESAAMLNSAADLSIIDDSIDNINSVITTTKREVVVTENRINELEKELQQYGNLDKLEILIQRMDKLQTQIDGLQTKIDSTKTIIGGIASTDLLITKTKAILRHETRIKKCRAYIKDIEKLQTKIDKVKSIMKSLNQVEEDIESCKSLVALHKQVEKATKLANEVTELDNKVGQTRTIIENIRLIELKISQSKLKIDKKKKRYIELLKQQKECPTCGSEISKQTIRQIKENL